MLVDIMEKNFLFLVVVILVSVNMILDKLKIVFEYRKLLKFIMEKR